MNTYYAFIFGKWTWLDAGISTHLDIFLIPASMGLIGIYIMYKIFLRGFFFYRGKNNLFTIYSYILFSNFVTLYHHAMTLTVNVIILVVFISNRVNNSIKPKFRFDFLHFLNQSVVSISKKTN